MISMKNTVVKHALTLTFDLQNQITSSVARG